MGRERVDSGWGKSRVLVGKEQTVDVERADVVGGRADAVGERAEAVP